MPGADDRRNDGPRFEVISVHGGLHPLDAEYERCRDAAMTTVDFCDCTVEARERWDAELNRVYQILMQSLPDESKRQLRDTQRKWMAFRDAQTESIATIVGLRDGTIHRIEAGIQIMELTRARRRCACSSCAELGLHQSLAPADGGGPVVDREHTAKHPRW